MSYKIKYDTKAKKDIAKHNRSGNTVLICKLYDLIAELKEHPYTGTGQPEKLKHDKSGYWSRRITEEHRLVYKVEDNIVTVTVASATGHYD
jgi:toxin YoeB